MNDTVGATEPVQEFYDRSAEDAHWNALSEEEKQKRREKNEYWTKRFAEKPIVDNMVLLSKGYRSAHYPPKAAPLFLEFDENREMVAVQVDEETYQTLTGQPDA